MLDANNIRSTLALGIARTGVVRTCARERHLLSLKRHGFGAGTHTRGEELCTSTYEQNKRCFSEFFVAERKSSISRVAIYILGPVCLLPICSEV